MKVASLYSGGKDSTFSIYKMQQADHEVVCLISIVPCSEDSMIFHFPNINLNVLCSQAMNMPIHFYPSVSSCLEDEIKVLENTFGDFVDKYGVEGIVHGGISSKFQKDLFEKVCSKYDLKCFSPVWDMEPMAYMQNLVQDFTVVIVSVSAMGLDRSWLGKILNQYNLEKLHELSLQYGFNLNFEGGEGETFVTDCPLYNKKIEIKNWVIHWFGDRGIFEITEALLNRK
ncbi:MAG: diphthine--ammonia ligase [Nitrososphaeraceae archaeon]